ncbi:hypothetical protein EDB80DRAFT_779946 [Ilyonectria destructans]|nr:hypothetical protein EDB80DRAFT_779946 [Ilyonectria destructans]
MCSQCLNPLACGVLEHLTEIEERHIIGYAASQGRTVSATKYSGIATNYAAAHQTTTAAAPVLHANIERRSTCNCVPTNVIIQVAQIDDKARAANDEAAGTGAVDSRTTRTCWRPLDWFVSVHPSLFVFSLAYYRPTIPPSNVVNMKFSAVALTSLLAAFAQARTYSNTTTTPVTTISRVSSTDSAGSTTDAATNTATGFVQGTSTSADAGGIPTAGIAMGALMGGAALLVNIIYRHRASASFEMTQLWVKPPLKRVWSLGCEAIPCNIGVLTCAETGIFAREGSRAA